ncbi:hypothetical protein EGI26_08465 [Lacihabitans sp. CCS-44]|uniref:hypothetical protein n=1 Tax=Lacihabitans sp. CCS-44 TaxID=2487331 RepID=UPI0020CF031A|nr:hypothetical protein [Lacihabitans sp. CCS-44]MCP9755184.1 hypothetical protein [Lacihabitans sp. CCS-44]
MAKKEINEKTFELNITSELLNLSKSFLWYLQESPVYQKIPPTVFQDLLKKSTFFAEGLTQKEEANIESGGYDVSINFPAANGIENRLMILQFKSGSRCQFSKLEGSLFEKSKNTDPEHVLYSFNDDSQKSQHATLRALADKGDIKPESVMYVFPRVTEKSDFYSKVGELLYHTSFVPVKELDRQAELKDKIIVNGKRHKFRVNYNGNKSEVNLLLLLLDPNPNILNDILSELICVQIERFVKIISIEDLDFYQEIIEAIRVAIINFVENYASYDTLLPKVMNGSSIKIEVNKYLDQLINSPNNIPFAPSKYTTIIPLNGLKMEFDKTIDLSKVAYQIF